MWWSREYWGRSVVRILGALGIESRVDPISPASLALLSNRAEGLILLDVRELHEIEKHSYSIPGALLTFNVDVATLIRWIPANSTVVFFAAEPATARELRLGASDRRLRLYALEGGLQAWSRAGLPVEAVTLTDRKWVDNR